MMGWIMCAPWDWVAGHPPALVWSILTAGSAGVMAGISYRKIWSGAIPVAILVARASPPLMFLHDALPFSPSHRFGVWSRIILRLAPSLLSLSEFPHAREATRLLRPRQAGQWWYLAHNKWLANSYSESARSQRSFHAGYEYSMTVNPRAH